MQSAIRNRWVRGAVWAVLAVLVIWALLWAAVPPLIKSQLPRLLGEQLGRKVAIGAVDFKPWSLELIARDLTVATADGQGTQAKIDRVYLNAELESLLRLAPILDAVHLDAPHLSITRRADGSLDIDDIRKQLDTDPAPSQPDSNAPLKFALRDVVVQNGSLDFIDRITDSKHVLQDLQLRVPTLSSLASARDAKVEPRLSFELDGVAFEATGSSTPYADARRSNAVLTFSGLNVAPYLVYLPAGLPVQPKAALLDAQLQIGYVQTPEPTLKVSGPITAHDVAVSNAAGEPMLALAEARIALADVSPLQQTVSVRSIEIEAPRMALRRREDGTLALLQGADPAKDTVNAAVAAGTAGSAASSPVSAENQATADPAKPWQVSVQQIALKDGQLVWIDRSTQPQAQAHLKRLQLQASNIAYPFNQPAQFSGSADIGSQIPDGDAPLTAPLTPIAQPGSNPTAGTAVMFEGKATDRSADVQWKLTPLSFDLAQPYLAQLLVPTLRGTVSAQGGLVWQAVAAPTAGMATRSPAARTVLRLDRLSLNQVALANPEGSQKETPLASLAQLEVADATIDLARRTAGIGSFEIDGPALHIQRDSTGRWMAQDWFKAQPKSDQPAAADSSARPADQAADQTAPAWSLKVDRFALHHGDVTYADAALAEQPIAVALTQFDVQASKVAYPLQAQTEFSGSAQLAAPLAGEPAPLKFNGSASADGGQVALKLDGLPVAAAEPFLAEFLSPALSGQATLDGVLQWSAASPDGSDGSDAGVRLVARANRLALKNLALQTAEDAPVRVGRIELTDAGVDLSSHHVQLGRLQIVDPKVEVARNADGRWMFEDWLKQQQKKRGVQSPARPPVSDAVEGTETDLAARLSETSAEAAKPAGWSFALNDFKLEGGDISYTDRALTEQVVRAELAKLQLQASQLALPFAEPAAFSGSAQLNTADGASTAPVTFSGTASDSQVSVDLQLEGLPFAAARPFYAKFLKPMLSGSATLDGAVRWQAATASGGASDARLTLRANRLTLNDIALAEAKQRLAAIDRVTVADAAIDLSAQRVRIGKVELRAPKAEVTRNADGRWMFEDWVRASATSDAADGGRNEKAAAPAPAWKVDLAQLSVAAGAIDYRDRALAETPVELDLSKIELQADQLGFPLDRPARFTGSAMLANEASAKAPSKLLFKGSASAAQASVDLQAEGLPLALAQPFSASLLVPTLQGRASIDGMVDWKAAASAGGGAKTVVQARRLALDDVALTQDGSELARIDQVAVSDATLDVAARKVQIGKVQISEPVATVARDEQGQWMVQQWLKKKDNDSSGNGNSAVATPSSAEAADRTAAADGSAWAVQLADLAMSGGRIAFRDRAQPSPVAFDLSRVQLETQHLTLDGTDPAPLNVSARIDPPAGADTAAPARDGSGGQFDYRGQLTLRPQLQANGTVDATRIPVHLFEPYFASQLNIEIAQADASFKGDTGYAQTEAGAKLNLSGDLTVQDLRANAVAAAAPVTSRTGASSTAAPNTTDDTQVGDELVSWKTLNLTGLKFAVAPRQAASVSLEQTALTDFFARMILYPDGKLNLQGLVKSGSSGDTGSAAPAPAAAAAQPAARIDIGTTSFVNGRIYFTDLLIQPNYSARLKDLTGKLGAFSSRVPAGGQPELARLELRGSTEQSASIEVDGRLNPLAKPLALDIAGKVRDLELPPFSPYAVKYAGHPIERGRLSMDVNYRIKPDGQLTADNNLVLTQLRFGEKVDGAPRSLPVKLATALLANSEGVIDLDLPISGSIDDPQFSIADVLGNAVGNLLGKAVTAPFSLIARAVGGIADAAGGGSSADALNEVTFAAGSAELTARARSGLDQVARALMQRDTLQLTIVGTAGNPAEREAWKQARLAREIDRERLNGASGPSAAQTRPNADVNSSAGQTAGTGAGTNARADEPTQTAGDAPGGAAANASDASGAAAGAASTPLPSSPLRRLYEQANIPKPRNPDGAMQPLSDNEMTRLLLARIEADDEAMHELAVQRGVAVRDYLESGGLSKSRLFLGEAKLIESSRLSDAASRADGNQDRDAAAGATSDHYLPHVGLDLETR